MQTEQFPYQPSALGNFILGQSILGYTSPGSLTQIVPAYLYEQYQDDADLQAFVSSFNTLAQGYLNWFNAYPLAIYTAPAVSGSLLDWIGQGVYGIGRPVISSLVQTTRGALSSVPLNAISTNAFLQIRSGTAQIADDDIYKRVLTWHLYTGDGRQMSIPWLRKRVARFLFGVGGSDISANDLLSVQIKQPILPPVGGFGTVPLNTMALNQNDIRTAKAARALEIIVPLSNVAQQFANLLAQGYLAIPFQVFFKVTFQ